MGYLAKRLAHRVQSFLDQKIIPLDEVRQAKKMMEDARFPAIGDVSQLDPIQGLYTHVFNTLVAMLEQMSGLPELEELCDIIEKAQEEYSPSGPPMSPLTRSFFNGWAFLDLRVGKDKETFASIVADILRTLSGDPEFIKLLDLLGNSRMGLYQNVGVDGRYVILKEVLTGTVFHVYTPLSYRGAVGELWYIRLLPPPIPEIAHYTAFTTPYVISEKELQGWERFLKRNLRMQNQLDMPRALRHLFKFGPSTHCWNEFVFEAYQNHQTEACFLTGLPDRAETRPHSRVSYKRGSHVDAGLLEYK